MRPFTRPSLFISTALLASLTSGGLAQEHFGAGAPADGFADGTAAGLTQVVRYSQVFTEPGAAWVRIRFVGVQFGSGGATGFLRLTSLQDGAVQILDSASLVEWQNYSAFFNGDSVRVEFIAAPSASGYAIQVGEVVAGFAEADGDAEPRSLCGTVDDRVASADPRSARVVDVDGGLIGTVFLIQDAAHSFLTSGQSAGYLATGSVIEFNAPETFPNGTTLNHPSPSDQYVYDPTSIQRATGGTTTGNNWGYFGCFANSTTGLRPYEAQGDAFNLADVVPAASGQPLDYFGFGSVAPPLFRTWSFIQKTSQGPLVSFSGTRITAQVDATFGDSGAPLIEASSGEVIGILFADGCTATSGANGATAVNNPGLRGALSRPLGITRAFDFTFPNGIPALISNAGDATLLVNVLELIGVGAAPDSGKLHYNFGGGWNELPMEMIAPNQYVANFPPFFCGALVDYFISVETLDGIRFPNPAYPPDLHRSAAATSINVLNSLDFEDAIGWTVENISVADGGWERGIPAGTGALGDPTTDYDGSGQCWLTGNRAGDSDVDGGPTRLRSPSLNLTGTSNAFLSFAGWFTNDDLDEDRLTVQVSTNGGLSYANLLNIENSIGWHEYRFRVADYVGLTTNTRFRFSVADNPNNSRTEAAIDAFSIIDYQCDGVTCTKGDVNDDGAIDGRDVPAFGQTLISGGAPGTVAGCAADVDGDGVVEIVDDLEAFVQCLLAGTCE